MEKKRIYLKRILTIIAVMYIIGFFINMMYNEKSNVIEQNPAINPSSNSMSQTPRPSSTQSSGQSKPQAAIRISSEEVLAYLKKQSLVSDLPKNGLIVLSLFNFNSGSRQWEESYTIRKGSVTLEEASSPDVRIIMHSRNLKYIKSMDICSVISTANKNGDLGFEYTMSNSALMWKYKGLMKYKACLGK